MPNKMLPRHLLFICSGNICRSPTAVKFFENSSVYEAKSAGTKPHDGGRPVTQDLIDWADEIFVMSENEDHHLTFLKEHFNIDGKMVTILDIKDEYNIYRPETMIVLNALLKEKLSKYINKHAI